jgi:hypothetical protein
MEYPKDDYDVCHLPKENEESAKEEDEQVEGESSKIIDHISSHNIPK